MHTAGRPYSPTLHPRTRPEANEFASKNRSTGDWFRHDGKNVEVEPPPPQRLQGYVAPEVCKKAQGEPEKWFQHDAENPSDPQPKPRLPSQEAKKVQEKVAGKEEPWYKTEENQDYYSARPKPRVTTVQGKEVLEKLGRADTNEWYQHEHGKEDGYQAPVNKSRTGPLPYANQNKDKMQGTGVPGWYQHDGKTVVTTEGDARPHSRVHTADAQEYLERNRGSAGDWYQHQNKVAGGVEQSPAAPRPARPTTADSENWFSHDAKKAEAQPKPEKVMHPATKEMVEKSRGKSMEQALNNSAPPEPSEAKPARVKPEAAPIAEKNQGMMSKYLNQDANRGYQSNRGGGRVVKQEASDNAARNRGTLSDNLGGGYAAGPPPKRDAARVKPEASQNAQRNMGSMGSIMGGGGAPDEPRPASRVKPEAAANRDRNAGQGFGMLMGSSDFSGRGAPDVPKQRISSASARAAADRNKGSIGSLLGMG